MVQEKQNYYLILVHCEELLLIEHFFFLNKTFIKTNDKTKKKKIYIKIKHLKFKKKKEKLIGYIYIFKKRKRKILFGKWSNFL